MVPSFHERTRIEQWLEVRWPSLGAVLRRRAAETPDRLAFAFLVDGEAEGPRLTYAELDRHARSIAAWLAERDLAGERVLMSYPPGLDFICGFMGCLYAGAIGVPMYPPHPHRADERLLLIAHDARPRAVLCVEEGQQRLAEFLGADIEVLATDGLPDRSDAWVEREVRREDPALLQYTSGSTGTPRGVIVGHGNLLHNAWYIKQLSLCDRDPVVATWQPFFHDMGLIGSVVYPVFSGAPTFVMAPTAFLQKPIRWLRAISHSRATHAPSPNFGVDLCVTGTTPEEREGLDLSGLRCLWNGAEPVRADTLQRFTETFAPYGFQHRAHLPCFGMAETTLCVTANPPEALPVIAGFRAAALERHRAEPCAEDAPGATVLVSSGQAGGGLEVVIVNPETRRACALDEVGEIWVAGPSIALGYWERPEETHAIFGARLADSDRGPYLRTGDLGFLHDGDLFITGRLKDMIIVRGRNVYPQDVERVAEASHSALERGACAAFALDTEGGEALAVAAELKRVGRRQANTDEILIAMRSAIAEHFDLLPHWIGLVTPLKLPKTSSGKIMRLATRRLHLAGELPLLAEWQAPAVKPAAPTAPASEWSALGRAQSSTERNRRIVAYLRQETATALGLHTLPDPRLGFEKLGVDSMMAVELVKRLQRWIGDRVELPATLLFDQPNIEAVARYLESLLPGGERHVAQEDSAPVAANEPVAIVGLACRFPGAPDSAAFWRLLDEGRDAIREVPPERWDADAFFDPDPQAPGKIYTCHGGFIEEVDGFDAAFFDISPREARAMDPQQRFVLEVAWAALEHAGLAPAALEGGAVGVFMGASTTDYRQALLEPGEPRDESMLATGTAPCGIAGRLSYTLGLRGPSMVIDTACSSSLVAVHLALQSLRLGECQLALAGGVNLILSPDVMVSFCRAGMLSPDGRCKTFDAAANGYSRGEGCGVVVLKRLRDAQRDGDRVLAVIRGSAVNQDGRSSGLTAPSGPSQSAVITKALAAAGVAPADVQYLEAHGTGTPLGDPIEVQAADAVYAQGRDRDHPLLIGSVKTNLGHLEAAAAVAGLIKVVLALRHRRIPPSLHFREPTPHIRWERHAIAVVSQPMAWPAVAEGRKRTAAVSSFGFVGTNAHLIVEEAPAEARVIVTAGGRGAPVRDCHLLVLSARTGPALEALAGRYAGWLTGRGDACLADLCYTANTGRSHLEQRAAFVFERVAQLREQLDALAQGRTLAGLVTGTAAREPRRVAFLFTGQGSQYAGMGRELYAAEPVFREIVDRCAAAYAELGLAGGEPGLCEVMFDAAGSERLRDTLYAQPALYTLEVALATLWRSWGLEPAALLGHSLGEYAAAAVCGAFSIEDGLKLVRRRAQLMQQLPAGGAMASVTAPIEEVEAALAGEPDLCISACNGLNTVISGPAEKLDALLDRFDQQGVYGARLAVANAFHSMFIDPILDAFAQYAAGVNFGQVGWGLVSSMTGEPVPEGTMFDASYWRNQARQPVRFAQGVRTLLETAACDVVLEIGPKAELMWLAQMCWRPEHDVIWASSLEAGRHAHEQMFLTAGQLYVAGASIDFAGMELPWQDRRHKLELPTYPFQHQRFWPQGIARRAQARVDACLLEVGWRQTERPQPASAPARQGWLILADERPLGAALAARLEAAGQEVAILWTTDLASTAPEQIRAAVAGRLRARRIEHVVVAWSPALPAEASPEDFARAQALGIESALAVAQALIGHGTVSRIWLVTRGAQAVYENEAVDPLQSVVWGFGRTFGLEHPDRLGALIDLPQDAAAADQVAELCGILLSADSPRQLALRDSQCWVPRLRPAGRRAAPEAPTLRVTEKATYLITGGTGALGCAVARHLAERGARRIVLASRHGPEADLDDLRAALDAIGCRLDVMPVDVAVIDEVTRLFEELERQAPDAPVRGIVHAAGRLQGESALHLSSEVLRAVLQPKVAGAWNLHRVSVARGLTLDFFVLFSSTAALLGLRGHSNYSAANAFLDGLAYHRRWLKLPAVSISWGPWSQGGMATQVSAAEWEAAGTRLMAPDVAMEALSRLAAGVVAQVGVQDLNLARWGELAQTGMLPPVLEEFMADLLLAGGPDRGAAAGVVRDRAPAAAGALVQRLQTVGADARPAALELEVRREVGAVLGIAPETINPDASFFDAGMNSIMAVELSSRLQAQLGGALKLRPVSIFEHPTISRLTAFLLAALFGAGVAASGAAPPAASAPVAADDVLLQDEDYTVRWCRPSDKADILSLAHEVWSTPIADNMARIWDWKYLGNPFNTSGRALIIVVEHGGRIVASQGIMPAKLKLGEHIRTVFWGVDTQVHARHPRTAGLLALALERVVTEIFLGTPNEKTCGILAKSGDGEPLVRYTRHVAILQLAPLLRARGANAVAAALGGLCFRPIAAAGLRFGLFALGSGRLHVGEWSVGSEEFAAFWERVAPDYSGIPVRDQAYLAWRFTDCPNKRYTLLAARRDGQLAGYVALRNGRADSVKRGVIVDLLTARHDREALAALISAALKVFADRGMHKVECLIASTQEEVGAALKRSGFFLRRPAHVIVNPLGLRREQVRAVRDWRFTFADSDVDMDID